MTSEARTIAGCIRLAKGCIDDARLLADQGSRNAAYLAEQSLEQIIRALATSERMHIPRHDAHLLDKTTRRLPADHPMLPRLAKLIWLEAYATSFRYVTPSGQVPPAPAVDKLLAAISEIDQLVGLLSAHFGVDHHDQRSSARSSAPMR